MTCLIEPGTSLLFSTLNHSIFRNLRTSMQRRNNSPELYVGHAERCQYGERSFVGFGYSLS